MIRQSQLGLIFRKLICNTHKIYIEYGGSNSDLISYFFPNRQSLLVLLYTAFGSMFSNHFSSDSDFPPSRYRPRRNSIDYYTYNHHTGSKLHYHLFVVQICFSLSLIYVWICIARHWYMYIGNSYHSLSTDKDRYDDRVWVRTYLQLSLLVFLNIKPIISFA